MGELISYQTNYSQIIVAHVRDFQVVVTPHCSYESVPYGHPLPHETISYNLKTPLQSVDIFTILINAFEHSL